MGNGARRGWAVTQAWWHQQDRLLFAPVARLGGQMAVCGAPVLSPGALVKHFTNGMDDAVG